MPFAVATFIAFTSFYIRRAKDRVKNLLIIETFTMETITVNKRFHGEKNEFPFYRPTSDELQSILYLNFYKLYKVLTLILQDLILPFQIFNVMLMGRVFPPHKLNILCCLLQYLSSAGLIGIKECLTVKNQSKRSFSLVQNMNKFVD